MSSLNRDIVGFPKLLFELLRIGLKNGTITKSKPIDATEICTRWSKKYPDEPKTDVDIRAAVHELRTAGYAIGSRSGSPSGYWLCSTSKEFLESCEHLKSRAMKEFAAYYNPLKAFGDWATEDLMKHPLGKLLLENFNTEHTNLSA